MASLTVYRIAKWQETFERAESRKLKQLTWISMPIKFSSSGYQAMLDEFEDDAAAMYGAWCALTAIGAQCHVRGVLGSSRGIPLKTSHMARLTGFSAEYFDRLIRWASHPAVAWLEVVSPSEAAEIFPGYQGNQGLNEISGESPGEAPAPQENPPHTGQDRTRHNKTGQDTTAPVLTSFVFVLADGSEWTLPYGKHDEYRSSFPELDLEREYRKAAQWLRDNPKRRKTSRGVAAFLGSWLARAQDRGQAALERVGIPTTFTQIKQANTKAAGDEFERLEFFTNGR